MDDNPYSPPGLGSRATARSLPSGRIFLFSSLLPSFTLAIDSERELYRLLNGEIEPHEWASSMYAVNAYGQRGIVRFSDRFHIEWTDDLIEPDELRRVMTRRLQLLRYKDADFATAVAEISDIADFDAVYARFPDRAERAGRVRGCLYAAFVAFVVVAFVLARFRRVWFHLLST
jgi:hypothetical protein